MKYVEEGIDANGDKCYFLLEDAELLAIYYTEEEALQAINN